jgi:hypothetical protein
MPPEQAGSRYLLTPEKLAKFPSAVPGQAQVSEDWQLLAAAWAEGPPAACHP